MDISLFDYTLPNNLIAQKPMSPRDASKLLVIDRKKSSFSHHIFKDILDLITKDDLIVFNNTKVFPARLYGVKDNGGKIEILLIKNEENNTWSALRKGKIKINQKIYFEDLEAQVLDSNELIIKLKFNKPIETYIDKIGKTPLPPYITSVESEKSIREKYQTVYAHSSGSVAAPTAGLHFTDDLLTKLKEKGVTLEYITLHVGLGTFLPIKTNDITKHHMHEEFVTIETSTWQKILKAKNAGKRIIAIGTTTTRALESKALNEGLDSTNLFIYPPFKFNIVDAMITNFHLPKSTLLALISAFVTEPNSTNKFTDFKSSIVGKAYEIAIRENYRFYSFGDACFIL